MRLARLLCWLLCLRKLWFVIPPSENRPLLMGGHWSLYYQTSLNLCLDMLHPTGALCVRRVPPLRPSAVRPLAHFSLLLWDSKPICIHPIEHPQPLMTVPQLITRLTYSNPQLLGTNLCFGEGSFAAYCSSNLSLCEQ